MALQKVTLATLEAVGLRTAARMFDVELERVVQDLCGRPGDKSERAVVLTFRCTPSVVVCSR